MKIRYLKSAKWDLLDGQRFYAKQAPGLGDYFLNCIFSDVDSLLIHAGVHSVHFGGYFRLLSKRFPFAIYYRIEDDEINIFAVLDCRRDPAWIRQRMENLK